MKGPSSPVALLADAPALSRPDAPALPRPDVLARALLRDSTASQVGFATAALLGVGLLISIVTTPDPFWWQLHFSRLGTFATFSGYAFNTTIVLTGVGVVAFGLRLRREMVRHAGTAVLTNRRAATVVPVLVALLGIHLSFVGFIPVNSNEFLHDRSSTGAVFCFVVILVSSRWMLRGMHRSISRASRFVGIGLVATLAPYIGGFINLAAFELIVFAQVFWWLLLFARTIGRPADESSRPDPTRTGSMHRTIVVSSRVSTDHVAVAGRENLPAHPALRAATHPAGTPHPRRTVGHADTSHRPDLAHHRARGGRTEVDRT
jgi:hypothetical membrane protein